MALDPTGGDASELPPTGGLADDVPLRFPYNRLLTNSPSFEPYMLDMAEKSIGQGCPNGYLYADHDRFADWLVVQESQPLMAVRLRDGELERIRIAEFFSEIVDGVTYRFQHCDLNAGALRLMAATLRNPASLKAPSRLITLAEVLADLEVDGRDAAVTLTGAGQRLMAYCQGGKPSVVYDGDLTGTADGKGARERLLEAWAAAPRTIEVHHRLDVRADEDAGRPFNDYVHGQIGPPPFFLTVKHGKEILVRRLFQNGVATIGRGIGNDVIIDHRSVSRRHCEVCWTGNRFLVNDTGSSNGTRLNRKVVKSAPIQLGDLLTVGDFDVRFGDEPQRVEQSDLNTLFVDGADRALNARLVYGTRVLRIERSVFSIGKSPHASFQIKGMFIRPIQATLVAEAKQRYKLVPTDGGAKVKHRGVVVSRRGSLLESGDEFSVGRHRFVFMLTGAWRPT